MVVKDINLYVKNAEKNHNLVCKSACKIGCLNLIYYRGTKI